MLRMSVLWFFGLTLITSASSAHAKCINPSLAFENALCPGSQGIADLVVAEVTDVGSVAGVESGAFTLTVVIDEIIRTDRNPGLALGDALTLVADEAIEGRVVASITGEGVRLVGEVITISGREHVAIGREHISLDLFRTIANQSPPCSGPAWFEPRECNDQPGCGMSGGSALGLAALLLARALTGFLATLTTRR